MSTSEFAEAYEEDEGRIRGAITSEPIAALEPRKPVTVESNTSIREAVTLMHEHRVGCVLVVEDGLLAGIFTERDLLGLVEEEVDTSAPVSKVMTRGPDTLRRDQGIALALNKMSVGGFRHIPLVDTGGRPVGIIAMRDIVRFIVQMFPDAVLNVPPNPSAIPSKYGG